MHRRHDRSRLSEWAALLGDDLPDDVEERDGERPL
jgi:hypothetical protein